MITKYPHMKLFVVKSVIPKKDMRSNLSLVTERE